jgi:hypothetical protein
LLLARRSPPRACSSLAPRPATKWPSDSGAVIRRQALAGNVSYRTNNALVETFSANSDNELSTISRSGTITVAGTTTSPATNVTVNTTNAVFYTNDNTFAAAGFTLTNGNNAFTAIAQDAYGRKSTNTVVVNLPTSASYQYDSNGNLLYDGNRAFQWDDENELVQITVTNAWMSQFGARYAYDIAYESGLGMVLMARWELNNRFHCSFNFGMRCVDLTTDDNVLESK